MAKYYRHIVVLAAGLVLVLLVLGIVFRPYIRVDVRYGLVGPEEPTHRSIENRAGLEAIQAELDRNPAVINQEVVRNETLLNVAARRGRLDVVELLLDRGAYVDGYLGINPSAHDAFTPLAQAVIREHEDIVKLLLEYGADPYLKGPNSISAYDVATFRQSPPRSPKIRSLFADMPPPAGER
jgi:ankyrin repeat protein